MLKVMSGTPMKLHNICINTDDTRCPAASRRDEIRTGKWSKHGGAKNNAQSTRFSKNIDLPRTTAVM